MFIRPFVRLIDPDKWSNEPVLANKVPHFLTVEPKSKAPSTSGIKLDVNSEFTTILSVFASPKVNFPDKVISSATIRLCDICNDPDILTIDPV